MGDVRFEAKIEGLEDLVKELIKADGNVKQGVKGAVRAGGRAIGAKARSNARNITKKGGALVSVRTRMREGAAVASIFPAKGHAELRLIEYGTGANVRVVKDLRHPFKFMVGTRVVVAWAIHHPGTPARPWLRPAFDSERSAAIDAMGRVLGEAVEQARIAQGEDEDL